jgi:hypothetical protein
MEARNLFRSPPAVTLELAQEAQIGATCDATRKAWTTTAYSIAFVTRRRSIFAGGSVLVRAILLFNSSWLTANLICR